MDNLYDNLENYEDENIVKELKRENGELKFKLEEYTIAMDKLQKDFDKLSSEFKKLEINYSSLLKTAKEEIQRKTQLITNLNKEKDVLVLNSIQNKNIPYRKIMNQMAKKVQQDNKKSSFEPPAVKKSELCNLELSAKDTKRKELNHLSSEETFSSVSTENLTKNSSRNLDTKISDAKENISQPEKIEKSDSQPNALSIRNRRKSMPVIRSNATFSSEEDEYDKDTMDHDTIYKNEIHETKRVNSGKSYYDNNRLRDLRYRISETSSMDEKYSGYQESKRSNRNRRYNDLERFRDHDKHESLNKDKYDNQRFKRHFSPERSRRITRNNCDQYSSRYRVLESPPRDTFNTYERSRRDCRNDRDQYYDIEKNRYRHRNELDRNFLKHKLPENEETSCKRRKSNSHSYYSEEDKRLERQNHYSLRNPVPVIHEDMQQHISCQSPDYTLPDMASIPPVREIKGTSVMQLEDPRLHSIKYIVEHTEDNIVISSVSGRNVDLKMVNTHIWDINHVEVPKALTRRPSQSSEYLIEEPYSNMDIQNPVSNLSLESGEIFPDAEESDKRIPRNREYLSSNVRSNINDKLINSKENNISKYKIPKLNKSNKVQQSNVMSLETTTKYSKEQNAISSITSANNTTYNFKETVHLDTLTDPRQDVVSTESVNKQNNCTGIATILDVPKDFTKTNRQLVENDLELSDETNDNTEMQDKLASKKNKCEKFVFQDSRPSENRIIVSIKRDDFDSVRKKSDQVLKEHDKAKIKKQYHKSVTHNSASNETINPVCKKNDLKKDTKEMNTKFSELFGDSSSLITPEDLGLSALQTQKLPANTRIPLCENAQDAVDLNVNIIKNNQTPQSTSRVFDACESAKSDAPVDNVHKPDSKSKNKDVNPKRKKSKRTEAKDVDTVENETKQIETLDRKEQKDTQMIETTIGADPIDTDSNRKNYDQGLVKISKELHTTLKNPPTLLRALATSTPQKDSSEKKITNSSAFPEAIESSVLTTLNHEVKTDVVNQMTVVEENIITRNTPELLSINKDKSHKESSESLNMKNLAFPENAQSCEGLTVNHDNVTNLETNSSIAEQSSNNDTVDLKTDGDAPDVRIFVKRRRKFLKKS